MVVKIYNIALRIFFIYEPKKSSKKYLEIDLELNCIMRVYDLGHGQLLTRVISK